MIKEKIKTLAYKEAKKLKKYATKEEKDKLNITKLDAYTKKHCIYGQMTGHCHSNRAIELINKCCSFTVSALSNISSDGKDSISINKKKTNIITDKTIIEEIGRPFSMLEMFIMYGNSTEEERIELINYLKE